MINVTAIRKQVLSELESKGSAFLDWGLSSDIYKNCPNQATAEFIADEFRGSRSYIVYYQTMSYGSSRIPYSTPICMRIEAVV